MATTSNNCTSRSLVVVINRLRPRIAKISVEIILMIVLVAALINGLMILKSVLDQHTALQNSIRQVNKTVMKMEKTININMTDIYAEMQKDREELKEFKEKLDQFFKLSESVKQLNKTVEELIHRKHNSAVGVFGTHHIIITMLSGVLFTFHVYGASS